MTKYIHCNFSNKQEENNFEVKIGGVKLPISKFKYLGSILQNDRKINKDFTHIIQVGWLKSQKTSRVICDCKIPTKFKEKFTYKYIRLVIL